MVMDPLSILPEDHDRYVVEVGEFIAIRSLSTDPACKADVQRCAEWLAGRLRAAGLTGVQVFPTGGHPVVYGEWIGNRGPTLLTYGHYDVQRAGPIEQWAPPPFQATVRDDRLYGRWTADDKGQLYLHVKAAEAFLRCRGQLPVNIKSSKGVP